MKRLWTGGLALGGVLAFVVAAASQPPQRQGEIRNRDNGPPPGQHHGPPPGPPGRFELGRVLPPHVRDELDLTDEQEQQVDQLEREVKDRLMEILTTEQKQKLRDLRRHGPGGPPPGRPPDGRLDRGGRRPGGPPSGGRPERGGRSDDRRDRDRPDDDGGGPPRL